ncbi:MAG TPA: chitobiase/beta-hexosaminidase C-terminal domain-containing protein [Gaiellaceae bacterium]|nr:chitobiase/beta-hexosaminidase C-terminal domain-containing protein [Gaiellaceae bacterium]
MLGLGVLTVAAGSAGAHGVSTHHVARSLAASPQTVVTLTFDDGTVSQYNNVRTLLSSRGFHATFFINSAQIGTDPTYYMNWTQVQNLYTDGNEIAGHTISHPDLTTLSANEAAREVCYDRNQLLSHGYPATDFAYPFGTSTPAIETMVKNCGYNSARATDEFGQGCSPGPCAETLPPRDIYRTFVVGDGSDGLNNIEKQITLAENNGGGWAQLLFHEVCTGCGGFSPSNMTSLLNWLQGQVATNNVVIKTVAQVVGGPVQPAVPGPPLPPAPNGTNAVPNPSLETDANADGVPDCFQTSSWGTETATFARTTDAHTGGFAEKATVSSWRSGDASVVSTMDLGDCSATVTPGRSYRITEWYKSTVPVSFDLTTRDGTWFWNYWNSSPTFPASSAWAQASYVTPVIPAGVNGFVGGLAIAANGTMTVDDFRIDDANPTTDTTPPATTISCNAAACSTGWYAAPVSVTLAATDNSGGSGVQKTVYTTNGSDPSLTNGTVYTGAFSLPATTTVKYRSYDNAGNAETVKTQVVQVDTAAPSTTVSCNGAACSAGFYGAAVSVAFAATDSGGSGLSKTVYTTNGSDPSLTNGTVYSGAFSLPSSATVKYRSYDVAGNAEAVKSQQIQIDTTAPSSTISCNAAACSSGFYGASVSVTLAASDNNGGSGIQKVVYTTDGSDPSQSNGTVYSGAFAVSSTTTVKFRAYDNVGNAETTNSRLIQIDTAAPATTMSCNGAACSAGFYAGPVTVTLQASDTGGSGVQKTVYTTDGSDPSQSNGTVYSGPFTVNGTATVKYRSYDNAGNAESTGSQLIQIAAGAPTTTISCNGAACSSWYTAAVTVTLSASDSGGPGVGQTVYTTDGTDPSQSNGTVYSGAFTVSSTTKVKFRSYDTLGSAEQIQTQLVQIDTAAPSTGIACNNAACQNGFYSAAVSVTLQASDDPGGSGVQKIVYTTDGTDPAVSNGTVYSGPFAVSSTATVKFRAFDVAGNAEQVESQLIQVDTTAPATTISCNGGSCSGWYTTAPVTVTLAATDTGSGVSETVYTTDGTAPSLSNGTVYAGPFTVSSTTTVRYRSYDGLGNAEAVQAQAVQIDTVPPSSSVACNGAACQSGFYTSAVSVTLQASDDAGGSGVAKIVYTTNGSDPTASNGTVYTGAFSLNASATVKFRAFDVAGNAETIHIQPVQVDTTAPATTISCNSAACSSGWYNAAVFVTLSTSDNSGGSGVATTVYTTDGTDPSLTNGNVYAGAFSVAATATVKYRTYDAAGNAEQIRSQLIQIDTAAPSVTLSSPAANAQLSGQVGFAATASDNVNVTRVDFLVDGNVVGTSSASPYTATWNSTSVSDGSHTVQARAVDPAGNTTTTIAITVTVSNAMPNLLQNPGLESGSGNTPTCWLLGGYGTNTPTWTWTTDAHSGSHAESLTITGYTNGDRKLLQAFNATCATPTSAGHQYTISVWYKSTAPSTIFAFDSTTTATGTYSWWAQAPVFPAASTWTLATWTTPVVPAGFTFISTGMGMQNAGSLTMDDFTLTQIK